jgi:hypothetical protein
MKPRFLIDENSRRRQFLAAIRQYDAAIEVITVGDPALQQLERSILIFCDTVRWLSGISSRRTGKACPLISPRIWRKGATITVYSVFGQDTV